MYQAAKPSKRPPSQAGRALLGGPLRDIVDPFVSLDRPAFLLCAPMFASADAPNNVWMEEADAEARRMDLGLALNQFHALVAALGAYGLVYLLPSWAGLQDQVYTGNLGAVLPLTTGQVLVPARFRSLSRRGEEIAGRRFFELLGLPLVDLPVRVPSAELARSDVERELAAAEDDEVFFEGEADFKFLGDRLYVGACGHRTSIGALLYLRERLGIEFIPFPITNPRLFHLDCCVLPIDRQRVVVCTEAATAEALRAIERVREIIAVDTDCACYGITNAVRISDRMFYSSDIATLAKGHPDYASEARKVAIAGKICARLGLEPTFINVSEFYKSGGDLSCLVMRLNYHGTGLT
jgi:N-dimethylarginine dimethylaminohydrolase